MTTELQKLLDREAARTAARSRTWTIDADQVVADLRAAADARDIPRAEAEGLSLEEYRRRQAWREHTLDRRRGINSRGLNG